MMLMKDVKDFLENDLPDHCHFFQLNDAIVSFIGSIRGQAVYIVVLDDASKLSKAQIRFSSMAYQSLAEFYSIRSLDDLCIIAKLRSWYD